MKTTRILLIVVLALGMLTKLVNADFVFGTPIDLGPPVNSVYGQISPSISADGLQLYFGDYPNPRPGGYGSLDIWVATRATKDEPWGEPVNLGPLVNSSSREVNPSISADGLSLYFNSSRPGGYGGTDPYGGMDLWVTTRPTIFDPWGEPVNLGPTVNSSYREAGPCISADSLSLFFFSDRSDGSGRLDIWITTRESTDDDWGAPVNLGPLVNSSENDYMADISADGLLLFFSSVRPGGYGGSDLWVTMRETIHDPWGVPVNLGPTVNNSADTSNPNISADGSTLYFSHEIGGFDICQVPLIPIVDLNADGMVDAADMVIIVDSWGTDSSLCDIGPMPWGDGIVDVQDLIVLAKHLFEEIIFPSELIAYWKLDEIDGMFAVDSIGDNDGVVLGGAVWQPDNGQVNGALQLDGTSSYALTDFVLNPTDGEFSVFAWINGGAPGQVIISQMDGDDAGGTWLGIDAIGGNLMTGLVPPKIGWVAPQPLVSESVITDGQWHHVGFVWDGSYRALYVDGVEVAKDTVAQNPLKSADGGLYIGSSKDLDAGTNFSGLIDDVRIYNVALSAEKISALAK